MWLFLFNGKTMWFIRVWQVNMDELRVKESQEYFWRQVRGRVRDLLDKH